jgi:hypothetical protein
MVQPRTPPRASPARPTTASSKNLGKLPRLSQVRAVGRNLVLVAKWSAIALSVAACSVQRDGLVSPARPAPPAPAPAPAPAPPPEPAPPAPAPAPDAAAPEPSTAIVNPADASAPPDLAAPSDSADAPAAVTPPDDRPGGCPASPELSLCLTFEGLVTDGSPRRTPVEGRPLGYASGPTGRAGTFARGGTVAVPALDVLGAEGGTLEAWVRPGVLGDRMIIVDGPYRLSILGSGSAMCSTPDGYALKTAATTAGVWTTLACTFTRTTVALFVDGRKVREGTLTAPIPRTARATIGQDGDGHFPLDGLVDNLRVWQTVRTEAQLCAASPACAQPPAP